MALSDSFGRSHDYLRISLTDRCNLRCLYCMPHNDMQFMPSKNLMTSDEIQELATIFVDLGVTKIRLTGGEPLMRKDSGKIIRQLSALPVKLTMTTNGFFLDQYFDLLLECGVKSLNISLDTLQPSRFATMSQRNHFEKVWENIERAIALDFHIKINVVVIKGQNEDEINDFVALTKKLPIHVRFIEFMPFAENQWKLDQTVSYLQILERIGTKFAFGKIPDAKNDTARNFQLPGAPGTFAVISSVTNPFCDTCNRIRLTADGKIKNCLFAQNETDLLTVHRAGGNVQRLIEQSVFHKFKERGGLPEFEDKDAAETYSKNRSMISIGG